MDSDLMVKLIFMLVMQQLYWLIEPDGLASLAPRQRPLPLLSDG